MSTYSALAAHWSYTAAVILTIQGYEGYCQSNGSRKTYELSDCRQYIHIAVMVVFELLMLSHQCTSLRGPLRIDLAVVAPPPEDLSKYWRKQFQASSVLGLEPVEETAALSPSIPTLCPKSQSLELQAHIQLASSFLESLGPKSQQAQNAKGVGSSSRSALIRDSMLKVGAEQALLNGEAGKHKATRHIQAVTILPSSTQINMTKCQARCHNVI